ncbi:Ig-like domain-containing protein [Kribbella sp. NPDC004138]
MTRRMMLMLGLVALVMTGGGLAWGFWSAAGAGTGSAATGTLAAPTPVTASAPPGGGTVNVAWTASARATGYVVTRVLNSDGTTTAACGTTQASPTSATSCDDLSVADGTYHYIVTALSASWTASASSTNVTVHNSRPSLTVDQAAGQADPAASSPVNFTAVFSEAVTDFTSSDVTVVPATASVVVTGSGTTYNLAVSGLTSSSSVTVSIAANTVHDSFGAGNTASTSTDNTVTYDATGPTASAPTATSSLASGSFVGNATVTLTDSATDDLTGVASVAYYRCAGATGSCTAASWTAIGASTSSATNFAVTTGAPFAADGSYRIVAVATDAAGNTGGPGAATVVTVDTTPPTVARPTVNGHQ